MTNDARLLLFRASSVFLLVAAMLLVPPFIEDEALKATVPYLLFLLFLQLAPVFWAREPDLFAPPTIKGILAALATLSTTLLYISSGGLDFHHVSNVDAIETEALAKKVILVASVGLLCYYAGYYWGAGRLWRRVFAKTESTTWNRQRLRVVTVAALAVAVASYAFFQYRLGGSLLDVTRLAEGKRMWRYDTTLSWMFRGIQFGFLPVLLYLALAAQSRRSWLLLLSGIGLAVVSLFVARLGQRGTFMNVVLCALVLFHYLRRRIPTIVFVAILYAGLLVSNLLGSWRGEEPAPLDPVTSASAPGEVLVRHQSDRGQFGALALIVHSFPERQEYLLGASWLGLVATPIPRWVWPQKSQHFLWRDTAIVSQLGGGPIPAGFLGTLYANFSWLGVVLGMFLWGGTHRAMYEWLGAKGFDKGAVLLYAPLVVWFEPTLLGLSSTMQYVLPLWLFLIIIGEKRAREPSTPQVAQLSPSVP